MLSSSIGKDEQRSFWHPHPHPHPHAKIEAHLYGVAWRLVGMECRVGFACLQNGVGTKGLCRAGSEHIAGRQGVGVACVSHERGLGLGLQWWMVDDCKIGDKIGKESSGLVLCAWVMNAVLGFDFMWWI